jgi:hypothetical protein
MASTPAPADLSDTASDQDAQEQEKCARRWIAELTLSEKSQADWLRTAKKIVRLYRKADRMDPGEVKQRRFAMLWANTQTIQPAVYSRPPQAVVSRRFKDADPVARQGSEVLERAVTYSIDKQDLDGRLRQTSLDFVLIGRGQVWERYVPTHGPAVTPEIELQVVTSGDEDEGAESYTDADGNAYEGEVGTRDDGSVYGFGEPYEPVVFEESITDYVNWEDFGHSVARTWDEVDYVWRRVYLGRKQLIDRFGKVGKLVPLDWGPVQQGRPEAWAELTKKAAVYEIWCKSEKKVYWISKSWGSTPLDERDDPLGLDGFFPCPRPLLGTTGNDTAIPTPDYVFWQDQAQEIDKLTARIAVLQDALKVRGFYAGDKKNDLNNLFNSDTNMLIPVPDWVTLKEGGGIRGNIDWFPLEQVVSALQALIAQRQQLISDVYQITGVSDIQRGESDPAETASAQKIKATFGSLRIRDRQLDMQRFARDVLRIKGEVIARKFSAETLKAMTGVKMPTAAEKRALELQIQQQMAIAAAQAQQQAAMAAQAGAGGQPGLAGPQPQPMPPQAHPAPPAAPAQPPQMLGHNGGPPMPPDLPIEVQEILDSPTWEDVEALLQNSALRAFQIDIETDSTLEPDESEEKARTTELLTALGNLVEQWGPAIVAQPAIAPMVGEMIKFALRRFRAGRQLEETIDLTVDKLVKEAGQAPLQGPQPPRRRIGRPSRSPRSTSRPSRSPRPGNPAGPPRRRGAATGTRHPADRTAVAARRDASAPAATPTAHGSGLDGRQHHPGRPPGQRPHRHRYDRHLRGRLERAVHGGLHRRR